MKHHGSRKEEGRVKGGDDQRYQGVKSDTAADVDEGEQKTGYCTNCDRVERKSSPRIYLLYVRGVLNKSALISIP